MNVQEIDRNTALDFIMPRHYANRKPQTTKAFGAYVDGELRAVVTYGKPASNHLCFGIAGEEWSKNVYELNRLCLDGDLGKPLSAFVAETMRLLKPLNWIIVSYADSGMNHNGYIYQALNFLYTGATRQRTDKYVPNGKHSRHYKNEEQCSYRVIRTSKHRYVFLNGSDKRQRKAMKRDLKYSIVGYPKGDNGRYELGQFMEQKLVLDKRIQK